MDDHTPQAEPRFSDGISFNTYHTQKAKEAAAAALVGTVTRYAIAAVLTTSLESVETSEGCQVGIFGQKLPQPKVVVPRPPKDPPGQAGWWDKTKEKFRGVECEYPPPSPAESDFRHSFWKVRRAQVRAAYERLHYSAVKTNHFDHCGSACFVQKSPSTDRIRLTANHCHHRFCLACGQTRSRTISANLVKHISGKPVRFITLTLKHRDDDLRKQLSDLIRYFRNLRATKLWKSCVRGSACFVEVKRSRDGKKWHPHLHIIAEGFFIPQDKLSAQWYVITGDSRIVDVRFVREVGYIANYVAKYASKPLDSTIFGKEEWLDEAMQALHGKRLCTTTGTWRGIELEEKPVDPKDWVTICSLTNLIAAKDRGEAWAVALLREVTGTADTTADTTATTPKDTS